MAETPPATRPPPDTLPIHGHSTLAGGSVPGHTGSGLCETAAGNMGIP